jgi:hypothetical protein
MELVTFSQYVSGVGLNTDQGLASILLDGWHLYC